MALDVKETKNYSFVLAGKSDLSSTISELLLVTATDYGEFIEQSNFYSGEGNIINSIHVTNNNTFVYAGTT